MRTVCEHIAGQIANSCNYDGIKKCDSSGDTVSYEREACNTKGRTLLITGGGAHNGFLIDLIRQKFRGQVIIPDDKTIDFKEAIIFAFLGFLRANGLPNCLASVTGAKCNSSGGGMYGVDS
jgi:1,6-anhydro-N-acetylmuramate kinase